MIINQRLEVFSLAIDVEIILRLFMRLSQLNTINEAGTILNVSQKFMLRQRLSYGLTVKGTLVILVNGILIRKKSLPHH